MHIEHPSFNLRHKSIEIFDIIIPNRPPHKPKTTKPPTKTPKRTPAKKKK